MHPKAITLIYGHGGIGKGMLALWVIRELRDEGFYPIVLDYEFNDWEWKSRARSMGLVFPVRVPTEGILTESSAQQMAEYFHDHEITHCIIDSATAAKARATDNDFGAGDSTVEFFRYMRLLRVPVLLIGHEAKSTGKNSTPLGSVHFITQSRIVYHAEANGVSGIRLTCIKANDRDKSDLHFAFKIIKESGHAFDVDIDDYGISKIAARPATIGELLLEAMQADKTYDIDGIIALMNNPTSRDAVKMLLTRLVKSRDIARNMHGNYQKISK